MLLLEDGADKLPVAADGETITLIIKSVLKVMLWFEMIIV